MEILKENYPLRFNREGDKTVMALKSLPRTGWVMREIENPETVYEHTLSTRDLAIKFKKDLNLSEVDFNDLLSIVEVHDWPEAIVGDGVILGDEPNAAELKKKKKEDESIAMQQICADRENGEEIIAFYQRYESQNDEAARLAKELDKLQAVLKAVEYENEQGKAGLAAEFYAYSKNDIRHPYLVAILEQAVNGLI